MDESKKSHDEYLKRLAQLNKMFFYECIMELQKNQMSEWSEESLSDITITDQFNSTTKSMVKQEANKE